MKKKILALIICGIAICFQRNFIIAQETIQFGKAIQAEYPDPSNILKLSHNKPPKDLADNAEIVLISGYEPADVNKTGTDVHVKIDRPNSKVLLILTSYETVNWKVTASPKTCISAILTDSYQSSTVSVNTETNGYKTKLNYTSNGDDSNYNAILIKLNNYFSIRKIDAIRAHYTIPSNITISSMDTPQPKLTLEGSTPQKPVKNFTFYLTSNNYKKIAWTLSGATKENTEDISYINEEKVAFSPDMKFMYQIENNNLVIEDLRNNMKNIAKLPPNFPRFSWPVDVAYDVKRDIVSVVTFGGEGFLYRFDIKKNKWVDFRSLNDVDLTSLSYDRKSDRYIAWTNSGQLLFISGNGNALFQKKIVSKLKGFNRLYDRGNESVPNTVIFPRGDVLALVYFSGGVVKRIWEYNVKSETSILTYKKGI